MRELSRKIYTIPFSFCDTVRALLCTGPERRLNMKIGDEVFVHGFVDEIRVDQVIIKNRGGYFGTLPDEVHPLSVTLHGVWKTAKDGKYVCSVCGLPAPGGGLTNYCPNCGAKMDGERREE